MLKIAKYITDNVSAIYKTLFEVRKNSLEEIVKAEGVAGCKFMSKHLINYRYSQINPQLIYIDYMVLCNNHRKLKLNERLRISVGSSTI